MATRVLDNMAGNNWDDLNERSGQIGATWTYHPAINPGNTRWYIYGDTSNKRVHCGVWGAAYASGVPETADYSVSCDYVLLTSVPSLNLGITGRMSVTADTYYGVYYQDGELVLFKRVAGVTTSLGVWITTLSFGGTSYQLVLDMVGTTIRVLVNGTERISVTDGDITAKGRAGVRAIGNNDAGTGIHIDNFWMYDSSVAATPRSQVVGIVGL
jgi:hypothetical protein